MGKEDEMAEPRMKHFGWGREGEGMTAEEEALAFGRLQRLGAEGREEVAPPRLEQIALSPPRIAPPSSLATICSSALYDRAVHTHGKGFPDYARALRGDFASAPDVVAYPRTEAEVASVLDWAGGAQASVTPFGGGSSVVGGVEPFVDGRRH